MREMKNSGIEWVGQIPKDWKIARLCYLIDGYKAGPFGSALIMDKLSDEGNILIYTPETIATGNTELPTNKYLPECRKDEMQQFFVKSGDIIFPIVGSLGRAMVVNENMPIGIINQRLAKFRLSSNEIVSPFFMRLFGESDFFQTYIELTCRGSIIVNLTKMILHDMPVPIPPIKEQQQIANFLDTKCSEIDATTEDIQKEISLLEDYKKSVITEAVTKGLNPDAEMKDSGIKWIPKIPKHWKVIPSKYLFANSDIRRQTGDEQLTASQKYGIITQKDYTAKENAQIVLATQGLEKWKHVEPNDFIISLRSFQGGLEMSEITGCITWHYVVLKAQKKVYHKYYKWLFKSARYINALQGTCNFIRDGQDLRFSNFALVPLFELPLEEQQQIADYLDTKCSEIDTLIADKKRQLDILADYKKSLIYEYVTGKKEVPVKDF